MYEIWADDLLIYSDISPLETVKVIEPKLTLADCAAGSLEMTLPPINVGYNVIKRMITDIIVKCEGEELWRGRVLTDDYDFWNRRKMVVEGELAYLNDSIQPPARYLSETTTIETFITSLITIHNQQVPTNRQFEIGMITVHDGDQLEDDDHIYRFTNYETTLECFNDKLVNSLGGHLRVQHRKDSGGNDHRYIDYISDDSIGANPQIIRFGVNLMDFVKSFDMSELATALVPRGARLEEEEIEGLEPYLTVKGLGDKYEENPDTHEQELWHESGSLFVKNPSAISTYGQITAVVDWDNVEIADNLYEKAKKYLKDEQYDKMVLEIKAVDLHYAASSNARIKMLDKLRCISEPHGMDHTFPITQMEIRLDKPDDSIFTLGTEVNLTLTQATSKVNQEVLDKIDKIPSKHSILRAAEENAYQIITGTRYDGSYVHFDTDADGHIIDITITDGMTDDLSLNKWIWNEGGLGHMQRPDYQTPWEDITEVNVAITYDGQIVADQITTGVLRAYNNLYTLDTNTGYVKMRYGEIAGFNFDDTTNRLYRGNAVVSETLFGSGIAGLGLVWMRGGAGGGNAEYLQISNSGNFYERETCIDGIRIHGNGHIDHYDGNGNINWSRNLSDIPTS